MNMGFVPFQSITRWVESGFRFVQCSGGQVCRVGTEFAASCLKGPSKCLGMTGTRSVPAPFQPPPPFRYGVQVAAPSSPGPFISECALFLLGSPGAGGVEGLFVACRRSYGEEEDVDGVQGSRQARCHCVPRSEHISPRGERDRGGHERELYRE